MRYFSSSPRNHEVRPARTITTRGTGTSFAHACLYTGKDTAKKKEEEEGHGANGADQRIHAP